MRGLRSRSQCHLAGAVGHLQRHGPRVGYPSSCLTDNGLVFSGKLRGIQVDFESRLRAAGIVAVTSAPFHPQTCGKVERFQQTLKKWLHVRRKFLTSVASLNTCLEDFATYYNYQRPHGTGRTTPYARWTAKLPARPADQPIPTPPGPLTPTPPAATTRYAEARSPATASGSISAPAMKAAPPKSSPAPATTSPSTSTTSSSAPYVIDRDRRYQAHPPSRR